MTLESLVIEDQPITYGIVKPGLNFTGGVPVIEVKDFPNGEKLKDDLLLTSPMIEKDYKRSRLHKGDWLFPIRGAVGAWRLFQKGLMVPRLLRIRQGYQLADSTMRDMSDMCSNLPS